MESSLNQDDISTMQSQQRLTPCKFTSDHCTASFSSGLLVCVKPRYSLNGTANVVKVINFGVNDGIRKQFLSFPGPLIRGITHKKTVIEFCEEQIRIGPNSMYFNKSRGNSVSSLYSANGNNVNKASYTLLWDLLILLLRQNGVSFFYCFFFLNYLFIKFIIL